MPDSALPLDADRDLALGLAPGNCRPAIHALWRLDAALGAVVAGGREPMISRIKLAWWREALEQLDRGPPPAEPVLSQLALHVLPAGISGRELSAMEKPWLYLLDEDALGADQLDGYAERGAALFRHSSRLLGSDPGEMMLRAGEGWALVDLARHSGKADAEAALAAARQRFRSKVRWPSALRPIGALAVLAQRDAKRGVERLEPPGAPPRAARMLRHRLTGW
jgi:phytoene synthase